MKYPPTATHGFGRRPPKYALPPPSCQHDMIPQDGHRVIGLQNPLRFLRSLELPHKHRDTDAVGIPVMFGLPFKVLFNRCRGGLSRSCGEIAASQRLRCLRTLALFAQPLADAAFHLAGRGRDGFRWLETDQSSQVNLVRRNVEHVNAVWLQQLAQDVTIEVCKRWMRLSAMGSPTVVDAVAPSEVEFFELVGLDLHGCSLKPKDPPDKPAGFEGARQRGAGGSGKPKDPPGEPAGFEGARRRRAGGSAKPKDPPGEPAGFEGARRRGAGRSAKPNGSVGRAGGIGGRRAGGIWGRGALTLWVTIVSPYRRKQSGVQRGPAAPAGNGTLAPSRAERIAASSTSCVSRHTSGRHKG